MATSASNTRADLLDRGAQHVIHVHRGGRLMRQCVERRGAVGVVLRLPLARAQARRQCAGEHGDDKVEQKQDDVLSLGNRKGEARLHEEEIPGDGADQRRQQRRAAPQVDGDQQHSQQFDQPDGLIGNPGPQRMGGEQPRSSQGRRSASAQA
jgi:hypothetical protein